jgi:hypothetical protein
VIGVVFDVLTDFDISLSVPLGYSVPALPCYLFC